MTRARPAHVNCTCSGDDGLQCRSSWPQSAAAARSRGSRWAPPASRAAVPSSRLSCASDPYSHEQSHACSRRAACCGLRLALQVRPPGHGAACAPCADTARLPASLQTVILTAYHLQQVCAEKYCQNWKPSSSPTCRMSACTCANPAMSSTAAVRWTRSACGSTAVARRASTHSRSSSSCWELTGPRAAEGGRHRNQQQCNFMHRTGQDSTDSAALRVSSPPPEAACQCCRQAAGAAGARDWERQWTR